MRSTFALATILALALASGAAAKSCKDPTTHRFVKCPAAASVAADNKGNTVAVDQKGDTLGTAGSAPVCKVGKPCGKSCIAKNKVCHKP